MRREIDYRKYDLENFTRDHPDDPWLAEAEREATKETERAKGPRAGETSLDAKRHLDQSFEGLDTRLAVRMEEYGRGEAAFMKVAFVDRGVQEIWDRHLPGIAEARSLEERDGGRFARDQEIRLFRDRINDNPSLKAERQKLADMQAVRSTAVSDLIGRFHQATLERLGLDRVPEMRVPQELPPQTKEHMARRGLLDAALAQEPTHANDLER